MQNSIGVIGAITEPMTITLITLITLITPL